MYMLLADCKMPVFWRRKSQSSLNNNNAYSSNQNLSEKRYRSSQPDMTVDINGGLHVKKNAARPKSLSSLGQKQRRSLTAPSTPETEAKSPLNGCSVGTDPISIQLGTSTPKTQVKSSSPVMSGNRKAVAKESSPTCSKSRSEKFHKLFKSVPEDETPLDYYSCAFIGDILLHGILYVSPNWICFYSKIRARGHHLMIPMEKVRNISREKTALIIPNAIGVQTEEEKYVFGSFLTRDSTYKFLVSTWKKSQDSTDSTKDQSISSPEPSKLTETPEFSPSATSSPLENNNVLPSVIASPKQPSIVSTSNVSSLVDSSDSETSVCPDCGLVDGSDSDRVRRSSANQISDVNTTQLSDTTKRPHVHNLSNCFQFHKTYKALCHMSVKLQRIPRTSLLLAICTVMVVFLIMSAVGLTYKLLLLQAKLESRHIWNDVLKFEHREKTYSDIHAFHSKVHTATIQQLHSVLQSNLELLEEMNASFRNLHKLYSPKANCESPTPSRGDDCS